MGLLRQQSVVRAEREQQSGELKGDFHFLLEAESHFS
jgi:hypothetical protein